MAMNLLRVVHVLLYPTQEANIKVSNSFDGIDVLEW